MRTDVVAHNVGYSARIASDGRGNSLLVWADAPSAGSGVRAAVRSRGGGWRTLPALSRGVAARRTRFDIAMNGRGDAVVAWVHEYANGDTLHVTTRRAGRPFRPPQVLQPTRTFAGFDVAIDARGAAIAVWASDAGVLVATGSAGRPFSRGSLLGPGGSFPVAVVDGRRRTTVAWGRDNTIEYATRAASARRFGRARAIADAVDRCGPLHLATNARGDTTVLWRSFYGRAILAAFRGRHSRGFGAARRVGDAGHSCEGHAIEAFVDPGGGTLALWVVDNSSVFPLVAAYRPPGRSFGRARTLAPDVGAIALAGTPNGGAVAAWTRWAGDYVVYTSRAGPRGHPFSEAVQRSPRGYSVVGLDLAVRGGGADAVWLRTEGTRLVLETTSVTGKTPVSHPPASAVWTPSPPVSPETHLAREHRLQLLRDGTAVIAWRDAATQRVFVASRRANGWQLEHESRSCGSTFGGVDLAATADRAAVVYECPSGTINAAVGEAGGQFGHAEVIGAGTSPRVGTTAAGEVVLAWRSGDELTIVTRTRGVWGSEARLLVPRTSAFDLAVGTSGHAAVAWAGFDDDSSVSLSYRHASGAFGHRETIGRGRSASVAINASGNAVVVWNREGAAVAARRAADGSYETATLGETGNRFGGPYPLALGSNGTAAVAWLRATLEPGPPYAVVAAVSEAGTGSWSEPTVLDVGFADIDVAVDAAGNTVVAWAWLPGNVVRASVRPPQAIFGRIEEVSQGAGNASQANVALTPDGSVAASWRIRRGSANRWSGTGVIGFALRPCPLPARC